MISNLYENIMHEKNQNLYDRSYKSFRTISILLFFSQYTNFPTFLILVTALYLFSATLLVVIGSYFNSESFFFNLASDISLKVDLLIEKIKVKVFKKI